MYLCKSKVWGNTIDKFNLCRTQPLQNWCFTGNPTPQRDKTAMVSWNTTVKPKANKYRLSIRVQHTAGCQTLLLLGSRFACLPILCFWAVFSISGTGSLCARKGSYLGWNLFFAAWIVKASIPIYNTFELLMCNVHRVWHVQKSGGTSHLERIGERCSVRLSHSCVHWAI